MSLWHADYFGLKTIKALKFQEETLPFPLSCLNQNLDGGPVTGMEHSLEMSAENMAQGWAGELLEI